MYQPDYDLAASHWIERDRDSVHMESAVNKINFSLFKFDPLSDSLLYAKENWYEDGKMLLLYRGRLNKEQ